MVKYKKSKDFYNKKYNELKNNIDLFSNKVPLYNLFLTLYLGTEMFFYSIIF